MSDFISIPGNPGASDVAETMHLFGSNLFLSTASGKTLRRLDTYYDYLYEKRTYFWFDSLTYSEEGFLKNGVNFVDRYIHIDSKYYSSKAALQQFFNSLNATEVCETLFGDIDLIDPKVDKFYGFLFSDGITELDIRSDRVKELFSRVMLFFEKRGNFEVGIPYLN